MILPDTEMSSDELDAFKKELSDIKADMMRKELEEIKRERMKKELEDIRQERAAGTAARQAYVAAYEPRLSPVNMLLAAALLIAAGYLAYTVYPINVASAIDSLIGSYSLPISGTVIVALLAVILALLGMALTTLVKK